uniref:Suppressor APC domain containing 2 n=1 Tax=Latimeria chalumnae TaxID=7897 RepID=H3B7Y5_LATCH
NSDGLPCAFLHSMWTLFHILDDGRRGAVHLSEIESRWRGADARELPPGVLECLRRAAPASGYLTFDHFVAGLQIAVFGEETGPGEASSGLPGRPGLEEEIPPSKPFPLFLWPLSPPFPLLSPLSLLPSPPLSLPFPSPQALSPRLIISINQDFSRRSEEDNFSRGAAMPQPLSSRCLCEVCVVFELLPSRGSLLSLPPVTGTSTEHSVTSVLTCAMLKRMKELEQEKDFLLQGLEMVDCTRDWYHRQIQTIKEKQKLIGKNTANNDYFSEGSPSRLSHLLPKLQEVNRCLADLIFFTGRTSSMISTTPSGLSMPALNGLSHPPPSVLANQQAINMLKDQNRLLTKEVTDKSERITQLEQEKSALIKQLFEARAQSNHENSQLDSTFI